MRFVRQELQKAEMLHGFVYSSYGFGKQESGMNLMRMDSGGKDGSSNNGMSPILYIYAYLLIEPLSKHSERSAVALLAYANGTVHMKMI